MRVLAALLTLCAALAGLSPVEAAPRPGTVELKGPKGAMGPLAVEVMDDGASYVSADGLAVLLKGSWVVKGKAGTLTVAKRSAQFGRDQSRLTLQGQPLVLDSAARATRKGWLLPMDFLDKGLPRLVPGTSVVRPVTAAVKPPIKRVDVAVELEELRYRSYPTFTRIVIEAGSTLSYLTVPGKTEIRVRLSGLVVTDPQVEEIGDGLVKEARLESAGPDGVLKIILEGQAGEVKTASLQDPFRVVVDVYRPKDSAPTTPGPRTSRGSAAPLKLIVLDAGHGGHKQRADLFVSIHANAHLQAVNEGVETYFLSSEATDNAARQTAAAENQVVDLESPQSRAKTDLLKSILWDLAQSEFQEESSFLAETVQDSMTQSLRLVNRGVKQAGFYVLGGAAMPAVLIEIGFLTNPKEERKLATSEHREAIARAIYASLAEYKRRYDQRVVTAPSPPPLKAATQR